MPCMGPSKEYADDVGEEIFYRVLELLWNEASVRKPVAIPNSPDRYDDMLYQALVNRTNSNIAEWDENAEKLKQILQDMVWADHANGF